MEAAHARFGKRLIHQIRIDHLFRFLLQNEFNCRKCATHLSRSNSEKVNADRHTVLNSLPSYLLNLHSPRFISRHPFVLITMVSLAAFLATVVGGSITSAATTSFAVKQDFATGPNPRAVSGR